jgi:predicted Fe-Mo cluster-binding NifX family protein
MKIAITAQGADLASEIDPRFGRARYILIADGEGNLLEVLDNSAGVNSLRGAGIQAGKLLADHKVDVLLTGNCGPNAFKALRAATIKVVTDQAGIVRDAIERFQKGQVTYAESPNVEGHW